jgi:hypothetical protein
MRVIVRVKEARGAHVIVALLVLGVNRAAAASLAVLRAGPPVTQRTHMPRSGRIVPSPPSSRRQTGSCEQER